MKKQALLVAALFIAGGLAACGGNNSSQAASTGSGAATSAQSSASSETKIELSADKTTILVGESVTIRSSVEGVSFESRDTSVASVDASGVVTGLKAGKTTITARKTGFKVGTISITVEKAPMKEAQAILEFEDAEHYDPDDFWGMSFGGQTYGPGETPVEESESASGGKSIGWFNSGCKETIKFTASKAGTLDLGFMMAYNAEVVLDGTVTIRVNDTALDLTSRSVAGPEDGDTNNYYDWNEVLFKGVAVKEGENLIVVECVGQNGPNMDCVRVYCEDMTVTQIKVVPLPRIQVTSGSISIYPEGTAQITVDVTGASYASSNTEVATVDANGLVTGVAPGRTTIVVSKEGYKDASVDVVVNEPLPQGEYKYTLELEDAVHEAPDGVWGFPAWGMSYDTPVEEHANASGGKSIGWFNTGCKETLTFTSDKASTVSLSFMMAYATTMNLENALVITVNDTALNLAGKSVEGGGNNVYDDWKAVNFSNVALKEGKNTIVIEAIGNGPNMDCVHIVSSEELVITPVGPAPVAVIGKLDLVVGGYEFGPAINGLLLRMDKEVAASALSTDLFTVRTNGVERTVTGIHLADEKGNVINATSGKNVLFDLQVRYESQGWNANSYGSSVFTYSWQTGGNSWTENIKADVKLRAGKSLTLGDTTYNDDNGCAANEVVNRIIPDVKDWGEQKSNSDGTRTLTYKAYETDALKNDGVKNPLVIWLHGQGEGGTDVDIALLGNDVTNLGQDKVQSHFKTGQQQGAYVLAVQTPTMWMDDGSGQNNGGTAHSIYTTLLKDTIDKYVAANTDVDASRIILGGCSNGGYMTMEMAITYPTYFSAYYPTCEAYADSFISDADIQVLKDLPIWFTHAANDTTVNPNNFTVATYKRLMAAGASDVHFSFFENVRGQEGRIDDQYNDYQGHYSWIYVLKDECLKDVESATDPVAPSTKDVIVDNSPVSLWGWAATR